jgi:hypothetical protein
MFLVDPRVEAEHRAPQKCEPVKRTALSVFKVDHRMVACNKMCRRRRRNITAAIGCRLPGVYVFNV